MTRLVRPFRFALAGLAHLVRTQPNFRIEMALAAAAIALGGWLRITPGEWAAIVTVIALVLILESVNTALELAVDLASPAAHPAAKAAKDVAAAAVLIAALASIAVGVAVFGPRLLSIPST